MHQRFIHSGEWILIASGILMLISVGFIYFDQNFGVWFVAKVLYGTGVVFMLIRLLTKDTHPWK